MCVSDKFPSGADAAGSGDHTLRTTGLVLQPND